MAAGRHEKIAPAWPGFRLRGKLIKDSVNTLRADGPQVLPNMLNPRITCADALAGHGPTPGTGLPDPSEDPRPEALADAANAVSTRG